MLPSYLQGPLLLRAVGMVHGSHCRVAIPDWKAILEGVLSPSFPWRMGAGVGRVESGDHEARSVWLR